MLAPPLRGFTSRGYALSARRLCSRHARPPNRSAECVRIQAHATLFSPEKGPAGNTLTNSDVQKLRDDTPGVAHGTVHLNNAGCALPPRPVLDATVDYLQQEAITGERVASTL